MPTMADTVTAQAVFDALLGDGMTHIVGVPDNGTAEIFALAAEHGDVGLLTAVSYTHLTLPTTPYV